MPESLTTPSPSPFPLPQSAIHHSTYVAEDDPPVSFEDVSTAMYRIRNGIVRTPCYRSHFLSELCGTHIYVKNEVRPLASGDWLGIGGCCLSKWGKRGVAGGSRLSNVCVVIIHHDFSTETPSSRHATTVLPVHGFLQGARRPQRPPAAHRGGEAPWRHGGQVRSLVHPHNIAGSTDPPLSNTPPPADWTRLSQRHRINQPIPQHNTCSAGNHALALSWHGSQLGIPVHVFMPVVAPLAKVDKCRRFGANVVITGAHIGEAKDYAQSNPEYEGACVYMWVERGWFVGVRSRPTHASFLTPTLFVYPDTTTARHQVHQRVRRPGDRGGRGHHRHRGAGADRVGRLRRRPRRRRRCVCVCV